MSNRINVVVRSERWELNSPFIISRGAMSYTDLIVVEITDGKNIGRGESCPNIRYQETTESVLQQAKEIAEKLAANMEWSILHDEYPPGAARNAIDCAWWDFQAKSNHKRIWELLGANPLISLDTAYTISLDTPEKMANIAKAADDYNLLKLKLGDAEEDVERVRQVRRAAPNKRMIADANEGWSQDDFIKLMPEMAHYNIEAIEQPLPGDNDDVLLERPGHVKIIADESCHVESDLEKLSKKYDLVNIKLDKTGGLTEAFKVRRRAKELNMGTMIGCNLGTSLAMAPAILIGQGAQYIDLDGPLLLGSDREISLTYMDGKIYPPGREMWG